MRYSICLLVAAVLAGVTDASGAAADRPVPSPLDGRWVQTKRVSPNELIAHGMPPEIAKNAPKLDKPGLDFQAGRFRVLDRASGKTIGSGRYAVHGTNVSVVFTSLPAAISSLVGRVLWLDWSVYRDRLTFSEMPGRESMPLLPWKIHPWTRVRS